MKLMILLCSLSLTACASSHAPYKPAYQHATLEKINHATQ